MQDKKTRHKIIGMIIASQHVENQGDLAMELDKAGYPVGQATLSRDLKQLRVSKVRMPNGHSVYAMPRESQYAAAPSREEVNQGKWGVQFSGNLMVIHTPPGHASMVAAEVDATRSRTILGCVAGDDTILAALAEGADHEDLTLFMERIIRKFK